ncbi:hypothetical protein NTGZN8_260013 [Candidatus Nitrotoga fabula]|uniref:Uncharacterized protein n=1 Tax=Candidatus Nitrotoga fabula TaxID=2182327 RepID=A0A916F9P5_9PROT|nr:hypothetical protein NTGZN8_260013 [Candidatus Nitrotoga fabula]
MYKKSGKTLNGYVHGKYSLSVYNIMIKFNNAFLSRVR